MTTKQIYRMWEHRGWGDSLGWMDYDQRRVHGHLRRIPEVGDEMHAKMESGNVGRYEVVSVKRMSDPRDQFFATVKDLGFVNVPDCRFDGCDKKAAANIFQNGRIIYSLCDEHGPGGTQHAGPSARAVST